MRTAQETFYTVARVWLTEKDLLKTLKVGSLHNCSPGFSLLKYAQAELGLSLKEYQQGLYKARLSIRNGHRAAKTVGFMRGHGYSDGEELFAMADRQRLADAA